MGYGRATMKLGEGAWCWFNEPRALMTAGRDDHSAGSRATATSASASFNNDTGEVVQRGRCTSGSSTTTTPTRRSTCAATAGSRPSTPSTRARRSTTAPRSSPRGSRAGGPSRRCRPTPRAATATPIPNPIWSPLDQRLYLFWRGGNFLPTFSTSDDEGETWAPARTLMDDNEPQQLAAPVRQVRVARRRDPRGLQPGAPAQPGHQHLLHAVHPGDRLAPRRRARHRRAALAPHGRRPRLQRVGARDARPGSTTSRSAPTGGRGSCSRASRARAGYRDHRYWYARWDRQAVAHAPDHDGPARRSTPTARSCTRRGSSSTTRTRAIVYLARRKGDGWFQVEVLADRRRRRDLETSRPITRGAHHHVRPVVPRNHIGRRHESQVLFMTRPLPQLQDLSHQRGAGEH